MTFSDSELQIAQQFKFQTEQDNICTQQYMNEQNQLISELKQQIDAQSLEISALNKVNSKNENIIEKLTEKNYKIKEENKVVTI